MTSEERIDAALDSVLKASGSGLKNYSMQNVIKEMRNSMRKIISESMNYGLSIGRAEAAFAAAERVRNSVELLSGGTHEELIEAIALRVEDVGKDTAWPN